MRNFLTTAAAVAVLAGAMTMTPASASPARTGVVTPAATSGFVIDDSAATTDLSARRRHYRHYRHYYYRPYYRPYYRRYYRPYYYRPYYYGPRPYYYGYYRPYSYYGAPPFPFFPFFW